MLIFVEARFTTLFSLVSYMFKNFHEIKFNNMSNINF